MIRFHVDNLKSSHVLAEVNNEFEKWLQRKYSEHGIVKAHNGKIHNYLGMIFNYQERGKDKINMTSYIEDMLNEFPMDLKKTDTARMPAAEDLFDEGQGKDLTMDCKEAFHRVVAKGLFVSKRARPDIHPMIVTLCM